MKQFLREILTYGFFIFCAAIVCSIALYHFPSKDLYSNYETSYLVNKLNIFLDSKNDYNTAFVGTSKTLRQIDPLQFSAEVGNNTNAFNMGITGLFPFRMVDLAKKVSEKENLKTLFVEIAPLDRIGINYDSNPNIYALSPKRYFTALNYANNNQLGFRTKIGYLLNYSKAFLYKYLGFGGSKQLTLHLGILDYPISKENKLVNKSIKSGGFAPFAPMLKEGILPKSRINDHKRFLKNPKKQLEQTVNSYQKTKKGLPTTNDRFLKELISFGKETKTKGIEVIFILPPRQMDYGLPAVLNQKKQLVKSGFKVFDCSDPTEHIALYETENSFDISHLNDEGAAIFTSALAQLYKSALK